MSILRSLGRALVGLWLLLHNDTISLGHNILRRMLPVERPEGSSIGLHQSLAASQLRRIWRGEDCFLFTSAVSENLEAQFADANINATWRHATKHAAVEVVNSILSFPYFS
jgi:hypothetical protein